MAVDPMGFLSYSGSVLNKTGDLFKNNLSKENVRLNAEKPEKERNQNLKKISHVLKEHNEHLEAVRDVGRELKKTLTSSRSLNNVTQDVARQTIGTPIPGLENKIIDDLPGSQGKMQIRGGGEGTDYEMQSAVSDRSVSDRSVVGTARGAGSVSLKVRGGGEATDYETEQSILGNPSAREYPALTQAQYLSQGSRIPQGNGKIMQMYEAQDFTPAAQQGGNGMMPIVGAAPQEIPKQKNDIFTLMNGQGETYQIIPFEAKSLMK